MFVNIIQQMKLNSLNKVIVHQMAQMFEDNLPDTLYLNQYELSEEFGFTHQQWNYFLKLKEVDRLIESEVAQIAEIGARQALSNLQHTNANSADIQAAKELISNSRLIKQRVNQRQQVILTRIPQKDVVLDG